MKWLLMVLILSIFFMTGCAFVNIKAPLDTDVDKTELGTKTGTAEAYSVLWAFAWGDASYAAAAKNGNIRVINHADQELFELLFGLYTRWRVVVYGD